MNLLIDFLTAHGRYGAGEYHRRIILSILKRIEDLGFRDKYKLFALYDSRISISFEDMREDTLGRLYNITYINLRDNNLLKIIEDYKIDRFFIACGQRIGEYPEIKDVRCETICVTHDLLYEEWYNNHMYEYWDSIRPKEDPKAFTWKGKLYTVLIRFLRFCKQQLQFLKGIIKTEDTGKRELSYMYNVVKMLQDNPKANNIMVSEYSRATMSYNFGIPIDKISVFYSPERIETPIKPVENLKLRELIDSKKRYFLMVSCDRECKNPIKAANAFVKYSHFHPDCYLVMVGNKRPVVCPNQINMDFLSDSDLKHAMMNSYALLYPSFFEGFGYPPLEMMKYGKPVLCSNTTSIPEIMGNAPIYFSPFYESAIFQALMQLTDENYGELSERSLLQYTKVHERQEHDLRNLVDIILL